MDRGAARSRKRQNGTEKSKVIPKLSQAGPSQPRPSSTQVKPRPPPKQIQKPGPPDDPNQYKPKAIRTSAALIFKDSQFPIPPPVDLLKGVRRIDLGGSGVRDVSWLKGLGVTWLSLVGCCVEEGWEAVGSLTELSVLNVSGCGLMALPKSFKALGKLKAVVAMENEWTELDEDVISGWTELNSLIISHSPNLTTIPSKLAEIPQLSKLTFSHCPRLTVQSLPDLTNLPLLRDVRMNNLPQLTSLPPNLHTWGTGPMSLITKASNKDELGDGLECLDLGNCSLPLEAISTVFGLGTTASKKTTIKWPHLRSLSLHSNPLALSHPDYVTLLQESKDLPNLQIIDAKRVVERKGKGMVQESKIEKRRRVKREKRMKPTGANVGGAEVKMRSWGKSDADKGGKEVEDGDLLSKTENGKSGEKRKSEIDSTGPDDSNRPAKRSKHKDFTLDKPAKQSKHRRTEEHPSTDVKSSKKDTTESKPVITPKPNVSATIAASAPATKADPTALTPAPKRHTKSDTSVLRVIEVPRDEGQGSSGKPGKKRKEDGASAGGIDLKEIFKKAEVEGSGLGVGGW